MGLTLCMIRQKDGEDMICIFYSPFRFQSIFLFL